MMIHLMDTASDFSETWIPLFGSMPWAEGSILRAIRPQIPSA